MERLRDIPSTAVEVQTGLWAVERTVTMGTMSRVVHDLYSAEGYCFYIPANNVDMDGNLLPENERTYYQFMFSGYSSIEQINANVVSVPVQEGYEIANRNDHEIA